MKKIDVGKLHEITKVIHAGAIQLMRGNNVTVDEAVRYSFDAYAAAMGLVKGRVEEHWRTQAEEIG